MRRVFLGMVLGYLTATASVFGDARVVQKFDGSDTNIATASFTVQDKWEVLWFSLRPVSITLLSADGTVITGLHGSFKGSFYQPKGGTYYFQVNSDHPEIKVPWHLIVAEVGSGANFNVADVGPMFTDAGDPNYALPATVLPPSGTAPATTVNSPTTDVAQTPPPTPSVAPTPSPAPAPPANPTPGGDMSKDQARAVVLIKGDNAEGTGFMIKLRMVPPS